MNLVFFGSDEFAVPTLDALAASAGGANHRLCGVISQPDRPAGRGRHLHPTPVSQWALAHELPLIRPTSVNVDEVRQTLAQWNGAIGVVVAFGQKIGNDVLNLFAHGCINLHASLLPKYRGAAPVARAILNGEAETGLTLFRLVARMDAGPVVWQQPTPIGPTETTGELRHRLALLGGPAVVATLDAIECGQAEFVPQDDRLASPAPKLSKLDGVIDWNQSAALIASRIRGLFPWPGVHVCYVGKTGRSEEVLLARAVPEPPGPESQPGSAGSEVGTLREDLAISAGLGAVRLLEVKPASGRLMSFADYARGRRVRPGDRFVSPQVVSAPKSAVP
jgi:methionyl-tRNA formyltransferase